MKIKALALLVAASLTGEAVGGVFNRISTFYICSQISLTCDTDEETSAETIWHYVNSTTGSYGLVYTDSPGEALGFVDISDPVTPMPAGTVTLPGEPTTVRVIGEFGECDPKPGCDTSRRSSPSPF